MTTFRFRFGQRCFIEAEKNHQSRKSLAGFRLFHHIDER